jgi:hypothetical protein
MSCCLEAYSTRVVHAGDVEMPDTQKARVVEARHPSDVLRPRGMCRSPYRQHLGAPESSADTAYAALSLGAGDRRWGVDRRVTAGRSGTRTRNAAHSRLHGSSANGTDKLYPENKHQMTETYLFFWPEVPGLDHCQNRPRYEVEVAAISTASCGTGDASDWGRRHLNPAFGLCRVLGSGCRLTPDRWASGCVDLGWQEAERPWRRYPFMSYLRVGNSLRIPVT